MNLRPESKDTSAKAAKDRSHLSKATSDAVGLKEERRRLDGKRPKIARKRKKPLQPVLLLHPALQKAGKYSVLV